MQNCLIGGRTAGLTEGDGATLLRLPKASDTVHFSDIKNGYYNVKTFLSVPDGMS